MKMKIEFELMDRTLISVLLGKEIMELHKKIDRYKSRYDRSLDSFKDLQERLDHAKKCFEKINNLK